MDSSRPCAACGALSGELTGYTTFLERFQIFRAHGGYPTISADSIAACKVCYLLDGSNAQWPVRARPRIVSGQRCELDPADGEIQAHANAASITVSEASGFPLRTAHGNAPYPTPHLPHGFQLGRQREHSSLADLDERVAGLGVSQVDGLRIDCKWAPYAHD